MSDEAAAVTAYLRERLAPHFDQIVIEAQRRAEDLQREVADLHAARGTIAWAVEGTGTWYLNIAGGRMTVGDAPLAPPFMTVTQSRSDWARFASGAVTTGFLGGPGRRGLGQSRIERLQALRGAVRFVISGVSGGDWHVTTHFGPHPPADPPQTTVTLAADVVAKLQSGELNPQTAFMQGQVRLEGDAGLAMQLGMALFL